jgi:small subunit ribosomal protein S16
MLRIRLRRIGKNKQPSYRIVVIDGAKARDSAYLDQVGFYNPLTNPPAVQVDEAKAVQWLRKGAQPSEAVAHMLRTLGTLEKAKAR